MPLIEFRCKANHEFEANVRSDGPVRCPVLVETSCQSDDGIDHFPCGEPTERLISLVSSVFPKADNWRK